MLALGCMRFLMRGCKQSRLRGAHLGGEPGVAKSLSSPCRELALAATGEIELRQNGRRGMGSSSPWLFFERFTANSSSFFSGLSLLSGGFCSAVWSVFAILVPVDFGTDEAAQSSMQVPELQGAFSSRLSEWPATALLPQTRVPQSPKARTHAGLVGQTGEPKLLPGRQERRASPRLAEGASGLLEEHGPLPAPYLTRRLLGASSCGTRGCANSPRPYLTRPLLHASASVGGAYLYVRRQYLTRRHRHPTSGGC